MTPQLRKLTAVHVAELVVVITTAWTVGLMPATALASVIMLGDIRRLVS